MLLNVAYYAIDPPLLFHVMLSIKIKIIIIQFLANMDGIGKNEVCPATIKHCFSLPELRILLHYSRHYFS